MERDLLPRALTRQFEAGEKKLRKMLEDLRQPIAHSIPHHGSLDTAEGKMLYQFTNLQGKVGHALSFRSAVLDAHQKELPGPTVPNRNCRNVRCACCRCWHRTVELLDELTRRISPGGTQHQVLYL